MNFDKQITRMASDGVGRVLMFGRWWDLNKRPRYTDGLDGPRKIVAGYRVDHAQRRVVWSDPLVRPSLIARMLGTGGGS